jgi:glycerol-3-phosphate cytidylyltransferase
MKVLTLGIFDLFHFGHRKFLIKAAELGDLIVGVASDDGTFKAKSVWPVNNLEKRLRLLNSKSYVYMAIGFEGAEDEAKLLDIIQPDIVCRGDDSKDKPIIKEAEKRGIKIVYLPYTKEISSTKIREDICLEQ